MRAREQRAFRGMETDRVDVDVEGGEVGAHISALGAHVRRLQEVHPTMCRVGALRGQQQRTPLALKH